MIAGGGDGTSPRRWGGLEFGAAALRESPTVEGSLLPRMEGPGLRELEREQLAALDELALEVESVLTLALACSYPLDSPCFEGWKFRQRPCLHPTAAAKDPPSGNSSCGSIKITITIAFEAPLPFPLPHRGTHEEPYGARDDRPCDS
jgi:hypothetical protein